MSIFVSKPTPTRPQVKVVAGVLVRTSVSPQLVMPQRQVRQRRVLAVLVVLALVLEGVVVEIMVGEVGERVAELPQLLLKAWEPTVYWVAVPIRLKGAMERVLLSVPTVMMP
jgi:hypothetical protein